VAGAALVLLTVWIAGKGGEWLMGDASTISKDTPRNTTPAPVAAELKSEIADLKFEEPPPLEEWLKGRTILTVAQDGRGQFRTIADAVKALKPGQVVEILDQGPYRENLWIDDQRDDTGVSSRANPLIIGDEWVGSPPNASLGVSHWISTTRPFRLTGLILMPCHDRSAINFEFRSVASFKTSGSITIQDCVFLWPATMPAALTGSVSIRVLGNAAVSIQRSIFWGSGIALLNCDSGCSSAFCQNWFCGTNDGIGISTLVDGVVTYRSNVGADVFYQATAQSPRRVLVENNTLAGSQRSLYVKSRSPEESVVWRANLMASSVVLATPIVPESTRTLRHWDVRQNLLWPGRPNGQNAEPFGVGTIVEQPHWLSLDPHDHRNYMRVSNPSVVLNRDGQQEYIGALPPGPAPPEGDWFTRLLERWEEVQQRIEKLEASGASDGGESRPALPKDAPAATPQPSTTPAKIQ
jgi:hypothetical protein